MKLSRKRNCNFLSAKFHSRVESRKRKLFRTGNSVIKLETLGNTADKNTRFYAGYARLQLHYAHARETSRKEAGAEETRPGAASKINRGRTDRLRVCFNFPGYFAIVGGGAAACSMPR